MRLEVKKKCGTTTAIERERQVTRREARANSQSENQQLQWEVKVMGNTYLPCQ